MKQAIILAGGQGARLKDRLGDLPKPLVPIAGQPLLEHQIELARRHDFLDLVIFACYRADLIEAALGDGRRWGVRLRYVRESTPLGTAGAVLAGLPLLADQFLVLYGDTMVNVDLDRLWQQHLQRRADATLLLHPNDHPLDSDLVETDAAGWITAFHGRPHPPDRFFQNLVNAALYVVNKSALTPFLPGPPPSKLSTLNSQLSTILDFGHDLFPALLRQGGRLLGYPSPEYIKDIGTPQRYDRVCADFRAGLFQRGSLRTPQRAVFLDRDGTIIVDKDCLRSADQLELLPGAAEAVRRLNHQGWRAIVVTNQPVIAKGWCSEVELRRIHNKLETLLGREQAFLDRIYFCPHHPEAGFAGERPDLKMPCDCRKPAPGLVRQAARDLNLDLAQCWLVGDTTTDLQTARNAGLKSILVRTGAAGQDGKYPARPDYVAEDLGRAVDHILAEREHPGPPAGALNPIAEPLA